MYSITRDADARQHTIRLGGNAVGSITREKCDGESGHEYMYTAVLHDSATQDGRSRTGYQFTDTVNHLLEGKPFQYEK